MLIREHLLGRLLCIKRLTAGYHWTAKDIARDPINPMTKDLKWNLTAADSVDANNAVAKFKEMRKMYFKVMQEIDKLGGIVSASVVNYDTKVFFKGDYDEQLRRTVSRDVEGKQSRRSNDEKVEEPDRGS